MFVVFGLVALLVAQSQSEIRTKEPALNRVIHGSNGPYRDFLLSDCYEPHETSSYCEADWEFAYRWNNAFKECERVIYHGCSPTRNNFRTLRNCKTQAGPVCDRDGKPAVAA